MQPTSIELLSNYDVKINILHVMDQLMDEIPLDKLTIKQICAQADISHATFYRYFSDKYEVGQWHLRYVYSLGVDKIGHSVSWQEGYYLTEAAIMEERSFYAKCAKSDSHNSIDQSCPRFRRKTLLDTIEKDYGVEITDRVRFDVDAAVEVEIHLMPNWHYGKYDASLLEISQWIADTVPRRLFDLLNTPLDPYEYAAPGHSRK